MYKKGLIFGNYIKYNHYDIISINYKNNYLFCILEDNFTKFVLINENEEWLDARYIKGYLDLNNKVELIKNFEESKNKVYRNDYNIKNIENYISIKDGLKEYILFTIWFGDDFNQNRLNGYNNLLEKTKCKVININKNNLHHFIKKDYPLHKGFEYLSDIHKSDYLRCYLMHHYGGGYSDIKQTSDTWRPLYNELLNSDYYGFGYNCDNVNLIKDIKTKNLLKKNFNKLMSAGFFILKSNTEFTKKWYEKLHNKLDFYYEELKKNPAKFSRESKNGTPCPTWSGGKLETKYPIGWIEILGEIIFPLHLDYLDKIIIKIPDWTNKKNYK